MTSKGGHITAKADATAMRLIERAADRGEPCPDNQAIAIAIGYSSASASCRVLNRLEAFGLVSVERGAINRVVTILATGKRTAAVVTHQHWRFRTERPAPRQASPLPPKPRRPAVPEQLRVNRDPCSRCGTRADIGCQHNTGGSTSMSSRSATGLAVLLHSQATDFRSVPQGHGLACPPVAGA